MHIPPPPFGKNLAHLLGGLSPQEFLQTYWQKQPLFIPNALPDFISPLSPDELAGLACESEIESRLVLEKDGPRPWTLEHGPFAEARFEGLPDTHWSLLVQDCNKYVPALAELMAHFDFIPHWRIDDVMASYAPEQGSVGPHVDQYDVFLIQAMGTRRWQTSSDPVMIDNFLPDLELNIMRDFSPEQEWIVKPGDMLYLPPGVAHNGVALDDCMTLSVGFRAPSHAEIISAFVDDAVTHINPKRRYTDPDLQVQQHPGQITEPALRQVRKILRAAVADDQAIDDWFGQFITEAKSAHELEETTGSLPSELTPEDFLEMFRANGHLQRNPGIRFAFIEHAEEVNLFVDSEKFTLSDESGTAAALLCDRQDHSFDELAPALEKAEFLALLTRLFKDGYITLAGTKFYVEQVSWQEAEQALRAIRSAVFIHEQNVPAELEWDGLDDSCMHFLARDEEDQPVGCVRLLNDGHIGRLAVLAGHRGQGIGSALLNAAIETARNRGLNTLVLNAQTSAIDFYRHHGFEVNSAIFMDAGIPHQKMTLALEEQA